MKRYFIEVFAPGNMYNKYKIWMALSLVVQVVFTLVPSMLLGGVSDLNGLFLFGSVGLALIALLITKASLQIWLSYGIALYGLLLCFLLLALNLTNSGILIYLLSWSMGLALGYGREYYKMGYFFVFMSNVILMFALALYFDPTTNFSGAERLSSILSGAFLIITNIYLWSKETKSSETHYSERRKKYENIASLTGEISAILVKNADLRSIFRDITVQSMPQLELERCMIYLLNENDLVPVDDGIVLPLGDNTIVSSCMRENQAIVIGNTALSNHDSITGNEDMRSEIAVPIYNDGKVAGVLYGGHSDKHVLRDRHVDALNVIASFCGIKLTQHEAEESIRAAERTRLEVDRYRELDELKNRFIANISHDLKTPLSLIKGPAKQIAQLTKDAKIKSLSTYVINNADHLQTVVNQLLQLNSVDKQLNDLHLEALDLHALTQKISGQYEERAKSLGVNLIVDSEQISMTTDVFRLEQIIHNLLSNALRYVSSGGVVSLLVKSTDAGIRLEVIDDGAGIPKELHEKVFERFFKIDVNNQEGTGIGLSLVQEYVSILEGKIAMHSQVGKGTTFEIDLPLVHSNFSGQASKSHSIEKPQKSSDIPHILIVEDHEDLNEFISSSFEAQFQVTSAFNGVEALERMNQQLPDILITDLMMPEKDGKTLVEEIRANVEWDHIPIIVLSAKSQVESKVDLYELGVDNFLSKPFEMEELDAVVQSTLKQRKKMRDIFRSTILSPETEEMSAAEPEEPAIVHDELLNEFKTLIIDRLDDGSLSVNDAAKELGQGRNRFQKRVKELSGITPVEFIRSVRLEEARKMLSDKSVNVSEVAYAVGFSNLSYFTRSFKQEFDALPSEYQQN